MRRLLIVALMVVAVSACADDSVGDSAPTASSTMTSPGATHEVEFPDHVENGQDLVDLTEQQLDIFVGMTTSEGQSFAADRGFRLYVTPLSGARTDEGCFCIYARADADGVIVSVDGVL